MAASANSPLTARRRRGDGATDGPARLCNRCRHLRSTSGIGGTTRRGIGPRSAARPAQQLQVLADEIYTIKNHAQLEFSRPLERGVPVHAGAQREAREVLLGTMYA